MSLQEGGEHILSKKFRFHVDFKLLFLIKRKPEKKENQSFDQKNIYQLFDMKMNE